jgi:hypothetical protein
MISQIESSTQATAPARVTEQPRGTFKIPVSNGIFEHYSKLKDAIWLLLWYIDRTTKESADESGNKTGSVLGGSPRRDSDVARAFSCDKRTICRWRNQLAKWGYIKQRITPFGAVVEVAKSKKWIAERRDKNVPPTPYAETRSAQSGTKTSQGGTQTALAKKTKQYNTEIQQKAVAKSPVASELEQMIFSVYEKAEVKPTWRDIERRKLQELAKSYDQKEIVAAFTVYLEDRDHWLVANNYPIAYFLKNAQRLIEEGRDRDREQLSNDFEADSYDDDPRQFVTVEYRGHREKVGAETARDWIDRGIASPCRQPQYPDLVEVVAYGHQTKWLDRRKLQRYVEANICVEVKK